MRGARLRTTDHFEAEIVWRQFAQHLQWKGPKVRHPAFSKIVNVILGTMKYFVAMSTTPSSRYGPQALNWCLLAIGLLTVLPPLLRLDNEGWTGPNVFFVALGIVMMCFSAARLILMGRENRQERGRKRAESP